MSEPDYGAAIASLRESGADQWEPVRLHYLERLQARASTQTGKVQAILLGKLVVALAELQARSAQAQTRPTAPATDTKAIGQAAAGPRESLGDLTRYLAQHNADPMLAGLERAAQAPTELKSIRQFRNTWSKLSADKQVRLALDQAPKNAGPINSHMLVLRSLALMRELAPDYLNRFVSYADTLLCLEPQDKPAPVGKSSKASKINKAAKAGTAKTGRTPIAAGAAGGSPQL
jgi:hypothetical protein